MDFLKIRHIFDRQYAFDDVIIINPSAAFSAANSELSNCPPRGGAPFFVPYICLALSNPAFRPLLSSFCLFFRRILNWTKYGLSPGLNLNLDLPPLLPFLFSLFFIPLENFKCLATLAAINVTGKAIFTHLCSIVAHLHKILRFYY